MGQYVFNPNHHRTYGMTDAHCFPGWTARWATSLDFDVMDYGIGYNTKGAGKLENSILGYGPNFIGTSYLGQLTRHSLNSASADAGNNDCEVLVVVRSVEGYKYHYGYGSVGSTSANPGVFVRGSGSPSVTCYACYINEVGASTLTIKKYVAGTPTVVSTVTTALTLSGDANFIRFKVVGTTLYAKAWPCDFNGDGLGKSEPVAWDITTTDASVTGTGWVGLWSDTTGGVECGIFAVGTGTSPCPKPLTWVEKQTYLNNDDARLAVVEIDVQYSGATTAKVCMATAEFVSEPSDTPPSFAYEDCILELPKWRNDAPENFIGFGSAAFGDLIITNNNGVRDSWLTWNWGGRECKIYVGGRNWKKWDMDLALTCTVADLYASDKTKLAFRMQDQSAALKAVLDPTLIGGTEASKDENYPLVMGYVFNMEPKLQTASTLRYVVRPPSRTLPSVGADGTGYTQWSLPGLASYPVASGELRDAGISVSRTYDAYGLNKTTAVTGRLTTDLFNSSFSSWHFAVDLGYQLGTTQDLFYSGNRGADFYTRGVVPSGGVNGFTSNHGFVVSTGITYRELIDTFVSGTFAFWGFNKYNQIVYGRVGETVTEHHEVLEDDISALKMSRVVWPKYVDTYIYLKNWTIQKDGLVAAVTAANRAKFGAEGSTYKPSVSDPVNFSTIRPAERVMTIAYTSDASFTASCTNRSTALAGMNAVFEVQTRHNVGHHWLGQTVKVWHSRLGLSSGKKGLVVGLEVDLNNWTTTLKLLIPVTVTFPTVFAATTYANIAEG